MSKQAVSAIALGLFALAAHAVQPADPTAVLVAPDSFVKYSGAGPVGNNNLNQPNKLFWMFESTGTWQGQSVDSWFVFFDPDRTGSRVMGSVSFDGKILFVQDDLSELQATASFGKPGVAYDYSKVSIGLEAIDKAHTTYAGDTMTFSWVAAAPGDHIRVMTVAAVPEPTACALLAGGLFAVGLVARRRQPT